MGCGVGPAVCPAGGGLEAAVCMGQRPEEVDDAGCVRVLAAASGEIWIWLLVCLCGLCAKGAKWAKWGDIDTGCGWGRTDGLGGEDTGGLQTARAWLMGVLRSRSEQGPTPGSLWVCSLSFFFFLFLFLFLFPSLFSVLGSGPFFLLHLFLVWRNSVIWSTVLNPGSEGAAPRRDVWRSRTQEAEAYSRRSKPQTAV